MRLNITKNFIIAFFVILAIYQTSELWFEGFSNHNFFYYLLNKSDNSNDDGSLYSLDNIIINQGNNKLICIKNDIYKNENKAVFDEAIKIAAQNGTPLAKNDFDWNSILSGKSIIYQYNCGFYNHAISKMFGFDENILSNFSEKIDTVIITPNTTTNPETLIVGFGNRLSGNGNFFSIEKNPYIYTVYDAIGNFTYNDTIYYTSSVKNGLDLFKGNLFIPQWNNDFQYFSINAKNPFIENDEVSISKVESAIDIFFDNSVSKWSTVSEDFITYSDESTVVKYYKNDILEYYNYKTEKNKNNNDFYNNYVTAINTLKKDSGIKNEYYLKNYYADDEKTVFYFDYKIQNFPITLSEQLKKQIGMEAIIEVTVSEGRVSKYKRFVRDFIVDKQKTNKASKSFLKAIDEVFAEIHNKDNSEKSEIQNMYLEYVLQNDSKISLNWCIDINNKSYIKTVD